MKTPLFKGFYHLTTLLLMFMSVVFARAQSPELPVPDHVVILIFENKAYDQIIGSADAPYINALASDPGTAHFTRAYGTTHPSQPNYIDLFSGWNQGVTDNNMPVGQPFTTPNLARQLLDAGYTYTSYSEGLPEAGSNVEYAGSYVRRHNPVTNWMGSDTNQVPLELNQPFTAFPADYSQLPTISMVVPDLDNDMHDGSIATGDTWYHTNIAPYAEWALTHNSLLILTFDEDLYNAGNHIVTLFSGAMVAGGQYADSINHYNVLRTLEAMYGLSFIANADSVSTITSCWEYAGVQDNDHPAIVLGPNPADASVIVDMGSCAPSENCMIRFYDLNGRQMKAATLTGGHNSIGLSPLNAGLYIVQITDKGRVLLRRKIVLH